MFRWLPTAKMLDNNKLWQLMISEYDLMRFHGVHLIRKLVNFLYFLTSLCPVIIRHSKALFLSRYLRAIGSCFSAQYFKNPFSLVSKNLLNKIFVVERKVWLLAYCYNTTSFANCHAPRTESIRNKKHVINRQKTKWQPHGPEKSGIWNR